MDINCNKNVIRIFTFYCILELLLKYMCNLDEEKIEERLIMH